MAKVTNPADIEYKYHAHYNLAAIRRDLNSLVVRSAHDPELLKAIKETTDAALAMGKARYEADEAERKMLAEAREAREAAEAAAAAAEEKAAAEAAIKQGESMIARATAFLKGA